MTPGGQPRAAKNPEAQPQPAHARGQVLLRSSSKNETAEQVFRGHLFSISYGLAQGQECSKEALTEEDLNSQTFTPVFLLYQKF